MMMLDVVFQTTLLWLPILITMVLIAAVLVYLVVKAHKRKVETGNEGLIGEHGIYQGGGKAFVRGEIWKVEHEDEIDKGDKVDVVGVDRMVLRIRKAT